MCYGHILETFLGHFPKIFLYVRRFRNSEEVFFYESSAAFFAFSKKQTTPKLLDIDQDNMRVKLN